MRFLICGGRKFNDSALVTKVVDWVIESIGVPECIISGGAKGADALGHVYGNKYGIPVTVYKADWKRYGRGAGPIRNGQMLVEGVPDLVIAFPGAFGTADMVQRAVREGVPALVVNKKAAPPSGSWPNYYELFLMRRDPPRETYYGKMETATC